MITLIVPTRNRAHTLRKVLPSYFSQEEVDEFIFVIDNGNDDTPSVILEHSKKYPSKRVSVLENTQRKGASESRNLGVAGATNDYILFCDDDEFLEDGYAKTCLRKLIAADAGAVSGRRVYMHGVESQDEALIRFGIGMRQTSPFRKILCEYVNGARYQGDIELPFTNAIILTRRALLLKYPFDSKYAKGNGYREETDYQMNLYIHGLRILVTNECHSIHLPLNQVRTGGQRGNKFKRIGWSIYYTNYFYSKYYSRYAERLGLKTPQAVAIVLFSVFAIYRELLRPPLYGMWVFLKMRDSRAASSASK